MKDTPIIDLDFDPPPASLVRRVGENVSECQFCGIVLYGAYTDDAICVTCISYEE